MNTFSKFFGLILVASFTVLSLTVYAGAAGTGTIVNVDPDGNTVAVIDDSGTLLTVKNPGGKIQVNEGDDVTFEAKGNGYVLTGNALIAN